MVLIKLIFVYIVFSPQSKVGVLFRPMLPLTHLHDQDPMLPKSPTPSQLDTTPQPEAPPTSFHLTNGDAVWVFYHSGLHNILRMCFVFIIFELIFFLYHRQSQSSGTKKFPSGGIPQEVAQEANRRPVQRGQSEDVPNTYRSQVIYCRIISPF